MKQTEDGCAGVNGLSQGSEEQSAGDAQLAQAMEEYQALLAAGKKPDHDEFIDRYPEVADALADCLAGLDFLHAAAPNLSAPVVDSTPAEEPDVGAPLGDFRLIREVGRGGMGVVYEADALLLADALGRLPEDQRELLILRHLEGLTFPEVAQRLGRSLNSVKKQWPGALAALKRALGGDSS